MKRGISEDGLKRIASKMERQGVYATPEVEAEQLYDKVLQFVSEELSHSYTDPGMIADELTKLMANFGRDIEPLAGAAGEMDPEEARKYWEEKGY